MSRKRRGVVQIRVTPKTRNPFTIKALSISGVTWNWHVLNLADDRVEALIAFPDSVIFGQRDNIVQSALRSSLPGVYLYREWVAAGGLLAYGPNQASILGGPLPVMVDKILKGAKPGDLPVEHGKLELFVNRATARAMRIDLPQSLLSRADEVMA